MAKSGRDKMPMLIDMETGLLMQLRKHVIDGRVLLVSGVLTLLLVGALIMAIAFNATANNHSMHNAIVLILDSNWSIQVFSPDGRASGFGISDGRFGIMTEPAWPHPRSDATAVSRNGKLYVIGGNDGADRGSTQVDMFDVSARQWSPLPAPSLQSPRKDHITALVNGTIFVCGCHKNSNNCRHSCETLAPNGTSWHPLTNIPHCTWWSSSAVLVNPHRLLLMGSYCPGRDAQVHQYNAHTKMWSGMPDLNHGRAGSAAVALTQRVFVCGGLDYLHLNTLNSCEMFDPHLETWTTIHSMNERRSWLQLVTVNGKLYAIGGHNGTHVLDTIESYEPDVDTRWTTLPYRLMAPSISHAAATVPLN